MDSISHALAHLSEFLVTLDVAAILFLPGPEGAALSLAAGFAFVLSTFLSVFFYWIGF